MTPEKKYYRIEDLPVKVDEELEAAADAGEMPVATALAYIFSLPDLNALILAGQLKAAAYGGQETKPRGVHLLPERKAAVKSAATATGVKLGAAGRLVLVAKAGHLAQAIQDGMRAQMTAPAETPASA